MPIINCGCECKKTGDLLKTRDRKNEALTEGWKRKSGDGHGWIVRKGVDGENTVEHELTLLITPVCSSFSFTRLHLVSMEFPGPHSHPHPHPLFLPLIGAVLELCRYRFENGWKSFFMSLTWPIRPVFLAVSRSVSQSVNELSRQDFITPLGLTSSPHPVPCLRSSLQGPR